MWPCCRQSGEMLELTSLWQSNSLPHSAQFCSTSAVSLWLKKNPFDLKPCMQKARLIHVRQILDWWSKDMPCWNTWQIYSRWQTHPLHDSACCCQKFGLASKYKWGLVTAEMNCPCLLVLQAEQRKTRLHSKSPGGSVLIITMHSCYLFKVLAFLFSCFTNQVKVRRCLLR